MRGINSGNTNSASMATLTAVTFIVAFAPVLCGLAEVQENAVSGDCSGRNDTKDVKVVNVQKPNTTVTLKCKPNDTGNVTPQFTSPSDFKVCTQENCREPQPLSSFIGGGVTVEKATGVEAVVQIKALPAAEKIFYIRCGKDEATACFIKVVVAKAPSESGGVASGSPLSCAKAGQDITIKIPEKGSTAQFTCGKGLTLYPVATDKVFAEDCKKEERLKDIVRSDKQNVYTLTADKKPPKKKWCYLCATSSVSSEHPGNPSDYCLVHVESSSRTQSSSAVALAAMLPCVLALLHFT